MEKIIFNRQGISSKCNKCLNHNVRQNFHSVSEELKQENVPFYYLSYILSYFCAYLI